MSLWSRLWRNPVSWRMSWICRHSWRLWQSGGKQEVEDNCKPLLEENNLTVADVIKVADAYQVE